MPLTQGQHFNERYWIAGLIERGGFGAVYKAWDITLNRPVAIKESYEDAPEGQRQFLREAQLLANLAHPNLPRVIDFFAIPDQGQYLVMEFVDGQTLEELRVLAGGQLPEGRTLIWIAQVLDALSYIHTQNPPVIHRDIKPANLKITPAGKAYPLGRAMLVDFGVAKVYDPHKRTTMGARAVTPGFSPHEQYGQASLNTDARTDIYSLGATLYMLLTGQEPPESISRLLRDPLIPPRKVNPALSAQIETVMLTAMHNDPDQRFQSAEEFRAAISGLIPAAPPPPAAVPTPAPPAYTAPPQPATPPPPVFVIEAPPTTALRDDTPPTSPPDSPVSPPYAQRAAQPVAAYPRSGRARKSKPLASPPPANPPAQPPASQPAPPQTETPARVAAQPAPSPARQPAYHPAPFQPVDPARYGAQPAPSPAFSPASPADTSLAQPFPWRAVLQITLGWVVGWVINILFTLYRGEFFLSNYWVFGGLISGLWMGFVLRRHAYLSSWRQVLGLALGWSVPWFFNNMLAYDYGFFAMAFGVLVGAIVTAFVLRWAKALHTLRSGLGIVFSWVIAYIIGMLVLILVSDVIDSLFGSIFLDGCGYGIVLGTLAGFLGSVIMLAILRRQRRVARP
jgi:serine/threonine-protein kinase